MTSKFLLLTAISTMLLLAACTAPQSTISEAANKCPQIGIDINAPDFYQKHKPSEVEKFYTCMETELRPSGVPHIGSPDGLLAKTVYSADNVKIALQPALEYQRNLWRQVLNKEKKPAAAYESWMQFIQNERSIAASNQAAANAASAARAADDAANAAQQQQFMNNAQTQYQNMQLQQIQQQQLINTPCCR